MPVCKLADTDIIKYYTRCAVSHTGKGIVDMRFCSRIAVSIYIKFRLKFYLEFLKVFLYMYTKAAECRDIGSLLRLDRSLILILQCRQCSNEQCELVPWLRLWLWIFFWHIVFCILWNLEQHDFSHMGVTQWTPLWQGFSS